MDIASRLLGTPGVQKVPSPKLDLFINKKFLSTEECAALVDRIDAKRRPSTVSDDMGDKYFRTSETCDLSWDDPVAIALDEKIASFMGMDAALGEPLQGQRYAVGQEFKAHTDYFEVNGPDYVKYCSETGQRTWTAMIYLNTPEAGGATRFKVIDKIVQPEEGKLLMWNNLRADGSGNAATLHHAMKVRAGFKYVITKWYRQRPWPRPAAA